MSVKDPGPALQRLERILVIVPWLLENPGTHIDELAERFQVDRDELLYDLDLLGYCGLPGYGGGDLIEVRMLGDEVSIQMASFFERPLNLSLREAVTLLLAASAVASVKGLGASDPLERAIVRLETVLGADSGGGARIAVDLGESDDDWIASLRDAIERRRVVRLSYRSAQGATSSRDVEPWALTAAHGAWYLQGHCRVADGQRDFRLDRIRELELTAGQAGGIPQRIPPPVYTPSEQDWRVVLDVTAEGRWIAEWAVTDSVTARKNGRTRINLRTPYLDWAARLVMRLGDAATVVEPAELTERVADLVGQTLDRYDARTGGTTWKSS